MAAIDKRAALTEVEYYNGRSDEQDALLVHREHGRGAIGNGTDP
jgi:hypothetical protein